MIELKDSVIFQSGWTLIFWNVVHQAALYGRDPNWGRIAAAAGYSGVSFQQTLLRVELGDILLMVGGEPQLFDR